MDDGYAFPVSTIDGFTQHGMSLRDYYAGQALIEFASLVTVTQDRTFDVVAGLCYKMADAMLAQRMKDTDNG